MNKGKPLLLFPSISALNTRFVLNRYDAQINIRFQNKYDTRVNTHFVSNKYDAQVRERTKKKTQKVYLTNYLQNFIHDNQSKGKALFKGLSTIYLDHFKVATFSCKHLQYSSKMEFEHAVVK